MLEIISNYLKNLDSSTHFVLTILTKLWQNHSWKGTIVPDYFNKLRKETTLQGKVFSGLYMHSANLVLENLLKTLTGFLCINNELEYTAIYRLKNNQIFGADCNEN